MKKLRVFLFAVIISTFVLAYPISVSAEEVKLGVDCPESVNVGRSFDIIVSAESGSDIRAVQFNVIYDSDYLSFKSVSSIQNGDTECYSNGGRVGIIFLHKNKISKGELLKVSFTAKTGINSVRSSIEFESVEAVDSKLGDVKLIVTELVDIDILKKGDTSVPSENIKSSTKASNTASSKSAGSSETKTSKRRVSAEFSESDEKSDFARSDNQLDYADENDNFDQAENVYPDEENNVYEHRSYDNEPDGDTEKLRYILIGAGGSCFIGLVAYLGYSAGKRKGQKGNDILFEAETEEIFERYWDVKEDDYDE